MEFGFTAEQDLLRKSFSEFLNKECPIETAREYLESADGFSRKIWEKIADLGWLGLGYPEIYGGSEGSFLDQFILFEEIGKVQMPGPLFTAIALSAPLIHAAGREAVKRELLTSVLSGKSIVTLAYLDEKGREDGVHPSVTAVEADDGGFVLNGTRILVPYAHGADEILTCATVDGEEPTLFRIDCDAEGIGLTPLDTLTKEKTFAVSFENVPVPKDRIVGARCKGGVYTEGVRQRAIMLKCAEMIGGMKRVVELTVDYVKERHQFGKALGTLQVVQHYCVDMNTLSEIGRLMAYQAASLLSEGSACEKEVAMAKAWCSDGYKKCTWIAHQIHGGIGFTEEFDLHLFYKHAKSAELEFGDSWCHRRTVADAMGMVPAKPEPDY